MYDSLAEILLENEEKHRCLNGRSVGIGSKACVSDIERRIEDAVSSRDNCSLQSDARLHYNGLLKILRKKLRRAVKAGKHA